MLRYLTTIALALAFAYPSFAADTPVSSETAASALDGTEVMYCVQGGADRKCTGAQIKTLANTSAVRSTTTTSEPILNSDQNKLVTFSNASAVAATIAQAGSGGNFASGWAVSLKNLGAGTVTVTPTTSTVDGAASFTLTTGQGVDLYSDGTNYFTQPGKGSSGTVTTTGSPASGNLAKFSGSTSITNGDLTGDCTTSGALVTSCNSANALAYVSNQWYIAGADIPGLPGSNSNTNNGVVKCYPFYFHGSGTISALGGFVNTTSAGGKYSVAIYANNASTMRPTGTALGNSGDMSTTSSTGLSGVVSISIASPRWLWACSNSDNGTATLRGAQFYAMAGFMGANSQANLSSGAAFMSGVSTPLAYASGWTDLTSATWTEVLSQTWPLVQFKIQ